MTVDEIITLAETLSTETYSEDAWVSLFNMGLEDLTPAAEMRELLTGKTVAVSNGEGFLVIANDPELAKVYEFKEVYYTPAGGPQVQLDKIPLNDFLSKGWKKTATKILFQGLDDESSGTVKFIINNRLTPVAAAIGTPDLPVHGHYLLALYMAAQAKKLEEELENYAAHWGEYENAKKVFAIAQVKAVEA